VLIKVELWLLVWPYVCPDDEDDLKQSCVTHDDLKLSRMYRSWYTVLTHVKGVCREHL